MNWDIVVERFIFGIHHKSLIFHTDMTIANFEA